MIQLSLNGAIDPFIGIGFKNIQHEKSITPKQDAQKLEVLV